MKHACTIAVDAMGGNFAPEAPVKGARLAVTEAGGNLRIILVGDEGAIHSVNSDIESLNISVVHASETITMHDTPLEALKEKKDSSIVKISRLLKEKKADAIFSAGHTGAFMAASLLATGKIEGVNRPTIGVFYPTYNGTSFLLDVGANTDCKPHHLFHFGIMGATLVKYFKNIDKPKIGLLSIGEEATKGDQATIEAHKLFRESSLNFIGNIEGQDVLAGTADVVVCDGFVGNVLIKLFETVGTTFDKAVDNQIGSNLFYKLGKELLGKPIKQFKELFNYENHGGVPLLGINGVSIIGHGHSSPEAVKTAILTAATMYEQDIQEKIHQEIAQYKELH